MTPSSRDEDVLTKAHNQIDEFKQVFCLLDKDGDGECIARTATD